MPKKRPAPDPVHYPEVMTIDQLAEYIHLHKQVIYRHVKKGHIPVSRIGTTIRFKKSIIDAWLEDSALRSINRKPPAAGAAPTPPAPPHQERNKFVWE
ncbi:MAG: helix-turn-helix domain-containing protein [Candidatus Aureabacteria bacterium]|nr:helix-turn-helix domain-containing protein [Candidatus Auribacterota bacterium]